MLQQLLRAQFALFCMLSFGWAASAQCDVPLAFDSDLSDYSVECPSDLPADCDATVGANRGDVACVIGEQRLLQTDCDATTALGTGADGAIVLFDIDGDPNDDRYFIPTAEGMSLVQFENGVAHITGQVQDISNAAAILNVNIVYDNGVSGADWDGGFKHDQSCPVTTDITDSWTVYVMNAGLSYLIGEGDLDGTLLTLTHAPASEYFGFQIGEMANDRNCNYGAGGWFSYNGTLNGQAIQGAQGDVLLDLSCGEETVASCGEDGPSVTLIYSVIDTDCGDALTAEQVVTRDDTTDPTWDNAPADVLMACADAPLPVAVLTASDNCEGDDGEPTVTYIGESAQYDVLCTGSYKVDRTWEASDCSGNTIGHTQTITVVDEVAPVISGGSDYLAECDGEGNAAELANFLTTQGGATASDVCGTFSWSHDYNDGDLSDLCGATGAVDVEFTATDDCGNASAITLTFTIQDTGAPTLEVAPVHFVDCELYDPTAVYSASASDLCGDATVVLVSVNEVSSSCAGQYLHVYKAVDDCGNESGTMDQVVTLVDEVNPVPSITCPANTDLFTDENCNADTSVEANGSATGSATDNCDDAPSVAISHEDVVTPGCTGSYSIARTWKAIATDHCGNQDSTTCVQTITVTDNIAPVPSITCPAAYTVDADENCNADTTPAAAGTATATATDNCDDDLDIQISSSDSEPISLCDGQYSFVRTWTALATDDCGNSASTSCDQTITVEDNTAPTWNAYDVYVNAACEDLLDPTNPALVPISASDNCSDVTYSIAAFQLSGGCPGTWMRVWTATDDCGNNSETTEQYVQLYDIIAPTPVITCPDNYTVDADENCEADTTPAAAGSATATATDNCDTDVDITITYSDGESTSLCEGQYSFTRTWTAAAMDDCDNPASVSCDQLITVEDNTAPVIAPASEDHTVECDGAGNQEDLAAWLNDNGGAEATDNCSAVTWSHDYLDGDMSDLCAATGSVDVIFTASDDCGNSSQTTSTFTIEDTTAPAFSGEAEVNISCEEYTCDADALEALELFSIDEACGDYTLSANCTSFSGGCVTPVGAYFVEYTAEDECGNISTFSQIVILSDEIKPVPAIECPAAIELTADADCSADLSTDNTGMATASATDNCDAAPVVEVSYTDGEQTAICAGSYSFTRTFTATATDHCGNTDSISCDQLITVNDETAPSAPVISGPADAEVFLDADCATDASTAVTGVATATAEDNCDSDPSIAISSEDSAPAYTCTGDDSAEGSYTFTRTWTAIATDDCGNEGAASTYVQTIMVTDNLAPDFAGSANEYAIACDEYSDADFYSVMAADNCDSDVTIEILSNTQVSGSCAGTVLRTYKATDDCGNSTEFQQIIDLLDEVAPVLTITCPGNADLTADASCSADTSLDALGTATYTAMDNCDDELEISLTHADVLTEGCTGSYTIERTFTLTAEDHCENVTTVSCTQSISVSDLTAPSMDVEASNLTVECDGSGNVFDYLTWQTANGLAMASDNCSDVTWSNETLEAGDGCGGTVGYSIVQFTATDDCGNATSTSATFTIEDTTAPSISADLETSVPCDEYNAETPYGNYSATDICSGNVTTEISDMEVSGPCAGTIMRTYTATDACGNQSTFDQIINLTDDEAPTFTIACPADVLLSADENCSADTSVESNGSASFADLMDNCDSDVDMDISSSDATEYPCDGSMIITRTWTITAEDHCDNMTTLTCDQTITVNDNTAPSITCPANLTVECDGSGNAGDLAGFLAGASATDNCSEVTITNNFATLSDDCGATGSATVTFTATDACGNQSSCDATFTIEDTTAPSLTIEGPANQDLMQNASCDVDTSVDALGSVSYEAGDACGSASVAITHEDGLTTFTCAGDDSVTEGSYTFDRTFTATATDECGLQTVQTYVQTITVTDAIAPQFSNTCDLENGASVEVCCESYLGEVTIPEACEPAYADNCDSDVAYGFTETYVGAYAPTDAVDLFCLSTTPAAFEGGETCNGYDPHSLRVFALPGGAEFYTAAGPGLVANNADGSWTLTQSLMAADGSAAGWDLSVTYGEAHDWTSWSNQAFPTGYKRDCGDLIDDHLNWDYRIMESGSLIGTGDYAGSSLSLTHAPSNSYYALQLGLGANNMNDEYGYSGWFTYSGSFMGSDIMGSGDMFGDLDCCLPWSIDRNYSIADDCGNSNGFEYTVDVNGADCAAGTDAQVSGSQDGNHTPVVIGGAGNVATGKTPIRVTNLQPNPTNDISQLGFVVAENMRIRVDLVGMDGVMVSELFDGIAQTGVNHTLDIEAGSLSNGMYQIRLSSNAYLVVKKLLVSE